MPFRTTSTGFSRPRSRTQLGAFVTVTIMCMAFCVLLIALVLFIFHNMIREEHIEHGLCPKPIELVLRGDERSPSTYMVELENATCDINLRQAWYRFDGPNGNMRMPEESVSPGMCNTGVPFWFYGTHPDNVSLPMPAVACGALENDACKFYANIRVQHCGTYMAYYLQPLPKCYMAYCIGDVPTEETTQETVTGGSVTGVSARHGESDEEDKSDQFSISPSYDIKIR